MSNRVDDNLREAVSLLKDYCRIAEKKIIWRHIARQSLSPKEKVADVIHAFVWGLANAGQSVLTALAACDEEDQDKT